MWALARPFSLPAFLAILTVHDGTDDLVNLAYTGIVGAGKALRDGGNEGFGLEGGLEGLPAEARLEARCPGDAAAAGSDLIAMASASLSMGANVLLQHPGGGLTGFGEERRAVAAGDVWQEKDGRGTFGELRGCAKRWSMLQPHSVF
jgi:hypothetical protein